MADLCVKPAVTAITVVPVLGLVLQPVREGVGALEDKGHVRRGEEDGWHGKRWLSHLLIATEEQ